MISQSIFGAQISANWGRIDLIFSGVTDFSFSSLCKAYCLYTVALFRSPISSIERRLFAGSTGEVPSLCNRTFKAQWDSAEFCLPTLLDCEHANLGQIAEKDLLHAIFGARSPSESTSIKRPTSDTYRTWRWKVIQFCFFSFFWGWGLPTKSASGNEPTGASAECYSRFDRRRYIRDSRDMALLHSPFRISRKDIISGNKFLLHNCIRLCCWWRFRSCFRRC